MSQELSKAAIKEKEGFVPYFYTDRDTSGKMLVNIGYGEHHNDWDSYNKLIQERKLHFMYKDTKKAGPVSLLDIKADFELVKAQGLTKNAAAEKTQTRAVESDIHALFDVTYGKHETLARK
jgi:GH24 family phage-related lysozyme (muramidase)